MRCGLWLSSSDQFGHEGTQEILMTRVLNLNKGFSMYGTVLPRFRALFVTQSCFLCNNSGAFRCEGVSSFQQSQRLKPADAD